MSAARVGEHSDVEWKLVYRSPAFAIRSKAGVGITPPNVEGAAKPTSSVMISRIFGALFGGTTRMGQAGFDCAAFNSIFPLNGWGGDGMYRPSIVVVASGEPVTPVVCWGATRPAEIIPIAIMARMTASHTFAFIYFLLSGFSKDACKSIS